MNILIQLWILMIQSSKRILLCKIYTEFSLNYKFCGLNIQFNCSSMDQQIKSDNKNDKKSNQEPPKKQAFQVSIFKYVEKSKRKNSLFATLNQKQNLRERLNSSTCSNLIKTSPQCNRQNLHQSGQENILMIIKEKLKNRKKSENQLLMKQQNNGHKLTLSDWRHLYGQRNDIAQKSQMGKTSPDRMFTTDRLFYPSKKTTMTNFKSQLIKKPSEYEIEELYQQEKTKKFVTNQNFFHMYYRSNTPLDSDPIENQRFLNYLKQNAQKTEIKYRLRQFNEEIFNQSTKGQNYFVPYKLQPTKTPSRFELQQKNSEVSENLSDLKIKNIQLSPSKKSNDIFPKKNTRRPPNANMRVNMQIEDQNPQNSHSKGDKGNMDKKIINLAEICSKNIKYKQPKEKNRQINLHLFKARRNVIEKGIMNSKGAKSQNRLTNYEYFMVKARQGKTFYDWNSPCD